MHWAEAYLGQPWQRGGLGPDAWDCWGFLRHIQKTHYGIILPEVQMDFYNLRTVIHTINRHPERDNWVALARPADGAVALIGYGSNASHVGVYLDIDGGGVLHCQQHAGVIFSRASSLWHLGWKKIEYYRRADS